tara:strand:+ start:585 stop:1667 length:1083 start_codon:yes stop_codon:yes gene_type:complete
MIYMELVFKGKKDLSTLMSKIRDIGPLKASSSLENLILSGDNLEVMKSLLIHHDMKGKIDLVYIDPPYSSNNIFSTSDTRKNTISRKKGGEIAYTDVLKDDDFLEFIHDRLILLNELLSSKGSIFLHIDNSMGHYVKLLMDDVFGKKNFLNDISRIKCNPKNFKQKQFGNIKDNILFYSKSENHTWNDIKIPKTKDQILNGYKKIDDEGRRYTTVPLHAPGETRDGDTGKPWRGLMPPEGRHWRSPPVELERLENMGLIEWSSTGNPRKKVFAENDKGSRIQDVMTYKDPQEPLYPTEKNYQLLDILVRSSSKEGDMVLDCFCGSGGVLFAAKDNGRRFIGIDSSPLAIKVSSERLGLNN